MINDHLALLKCVAFFSGRPIHRGGGAGLLWGSAHGKEERKKEKVFPRRLGISDEWTALSSKSVKINLFQKK